MVNAHRLWLSLTYLADILICSTALGRTTDCKHQVRSLSWPLCTGQSWHQRKKLQMKTKRLPYISHQEWGLHRTYTNEASSECFFPLSSGEKELKHPQDEVKHMLQCVQSCGFRWSQQKESQIARYCRQGYRTTELKCVVNKGVTRAELVILSEGTRKQG